MVVKKMDNKKKGLHTPRINFNANKNILGRFFSNFGLAIDFLFKYNVTIVFLSLVGSLLLFYYVDENPDVFIINNAYSREVSDVAIAVEYEPENRVIDFYVDGAPVEEEDLKADVIFTGSRNDVLKIINNESYQFIIDASSLDYGRHNSVEVKVTGAVEDVNVTLNPDAIDLVVSRFTTRTVELQHQVINSSAMPTGLTVDEISISQNNILISGAEDRVNSVDYVAVLVDLGQVEKEGEIAVNNPVFKAYNSSGDIVDVDFETSDLAITVKTSRESFEKEVRLVFEGSLPEGKAIGEYTVSPSVVSVSGTREQIASIEYIEATVNVNDLVSSNQTQANLKLPPGVSDMSADSVTVSVTIEDEISKVYSKVPINVSDLNAKFTPTLQKESDKYVEVKLYGAQSVLDKVTIEDIFVTANLSNVNAAGKYTVPLEVKLTDTRLKAELLTQNVTVEVTEN